MASNTGMILDVSGSMRYNDDGTLRPDDGVWVKSTFKVIHDMIKHDVSDKNTVFAIAIGAFCGDGILDILKSIKEFQNERITKISERSFDSILEDVFEILERSGAKYIRKWAEIGVIRDSVTHSMLAFMLFKFKSDHSFLRRFVNECLPSQCKNWNVGGGIFQGVYTSLATCVRQATKVDIIQAMQKALAPLLKGVDEESIMGVKKASEIINGTGVEVEEITERRGKELLQTIEPFIYGGTPLYSSLKIATMLFTHQLSSNHPFKKILLVISDGYPTDHGKVGTNVAMLKHAKVTVVCCFIDRAGNNDIEPKRLYSKMQAGWEDGARFLFKLSSSIPTESLYRTMFDKKEGDKKGWQIDSESNETKLFMQIDHPDHMKEACELARNIVCTEDALIDILSSVSMDRYINQNNTTFGAQLQDGGTCYANATATVVHLATMRIINRKGGYPDFEELRDKLIDKHGSEGGNVADVLKSVCDEERLKCDDIVDIHGAMEAISRKRPVLVRFELTTDQWIKFYSFFQRKPKGILTENDLGVAHLFSKRKSHAAVLTSYSSEYLRIMNSEGSEWADLGFFRVKNAKVLNLKFIDVYWDECDLKPCEKVNYIAYGREQANKLMKNLKGLQNAKYKCPLPGCEKVSNVTEFSGTLTRAVCPKCRGSFKGDENDNILALNIYLTSCSQ